MATYSNNTTIKYSTQGTGSVSLGSGASSSTIYTVPANSYAIVQVQSTQTNLGFIQVNSRPMAPINQGHAYIGAGQTFSIINSGASTYIFNYVYVVFANSP